MRRLHQSLCEVAGNADLAGWVGLEEPFEMGSCLIDGTCLEADMHFPTDWVLLKDVASTLLKAIKLLRQAGLLQRMPQGPKGYAKHTLKQARLADHRGAQGTQRREDPQLQNNRLLYSHLLLIVSTLHIPLQH